ncbi:MAG: hypothetical protein K2X47_16540 [Bdellovibrionales bacterium]|nr:hypothetical protein [Bdellovibrionales bacterium]
MIKLRVFFFLIFLGSHAAAQLNANPIVARPLAEKIYYRPLEVARLKSRDGSVTFQRSFDIYGVTSDQVEANFFAPLFTGENGNGVGVVAREFSDGKTTLLLKGFGSKNLIRLFGERAVGVNAEAHDTPLGIDANFDGWLFDAEIDLEISTRWENGVPITRFDEVARFEGLPPDRIYNLPVNFLPFAGNVFKQIAAGIAAQAHSRYAKFDKTFPERLGHLLYGIPEKRDFDGDGMRDRESNFQTGQVMAQFLVRSVQGASTEFMRSSAQRATGMREAGDLVESAANLGFAMARFAVAVPYGICASIAGRFLK